MKVLQLSNNNILIPKNTTKPIIPTSVFPSSVSSGITLPSATSAPTKAPTRELSIAVYAGIGVGVLSFLVLLVSR